MKRQKGFTLIELLVVIAIIGILSAIVLASLNTARNRAKDATVQGQMSSARAQAEIYYGGNNNSYASVCAAGTNSILPLLNATASSTGATGPITVVRNGASTQTATQVYCIDSSSAWVAQAPLVSGYYCVDSSGASKAEALPMSSSATTCI